MKAGQDRLDIGPRGRSKGVDAHDACRSLPILPHLTDSVAKLGRRRPHAFEEVLARVGQGHTAGRAIKQPDPDPFFEAAHRLAQCGWRNAADSPSLGDGRIASGAREGRRRHRRDGSMGRGDARHRLPTGQSSPDGGSALAQTAVEPKSWPSLRAIGRRKTPVLPDERWRSYSGVVEREFRGCE